METVANVVNELEQKVRLLQNQVDALKGKEPQPTVNPYAQLIQYISISSATTLTQADLFGTLWVNCTSSCDLTLPTAIEGGFVHIFNYGTGTITVKNASGTQIGTLAQYQSSLIHSYPNSTGVAGWPDGIVTIGAAGTITVPGNITVATNGKGVVLKDSAGTPHYWRIDTSTLGVLSTTDTGTSGLSESEPDP